MLRLPLRGFARNDYDAGFFSNLLGKTKRRWTVFFKRQTMGKQIRKAARDIMPFALEVWLGQDAIIFIGKHPLSRTNEV